MSTLCKQTWFSNNEKKKYAKGFFKDVFNGGYERPMKPKDPSISIFRKVLLL
jgi:hypothetical protein